MDKIQCRLVFSAEISIVTGKLHADISEIFCHFPNAALSCLPT